MKRNILTVAVISLVLGAYAYAGSINTFATGETISASALNANFNHIHNTMVGGHGARLVNSDVSTSAAISHSKLATPALLPKAWAYVSACTTGTCTLAASSGITSITAGGTDGTYTVVLPARSDTNYGFLVFPIGVVDMVCFGEPVISTSQFSFDCETHAGVATDTGFTVMVLDNN